MTPFYGIILAWGIDWDGYFQDSNKLETLKCEKYEKVSIIYIQNGEPTFLHEY